MHRKLIRNKPILLSCKQKTKKCTHTIPTSTTAVPYGSKATIIRRRDCILSRYVAKTGHIYLGILKMAK